MTYNGIYYLYIYTYIIHLKFILIYSDKVYRHVVVEKHYFYYMTLAYLQALSLFNLILIITIFSGNPLYESLDESVWRCDCIRKLPKLVILDGVPIIRD